jgi:uroporphyrinogen decarboxylase
MKRRYNPDETGRFPPDFEKKCAEWNSPERDFLLEINVNGPFWQLREWLGFEGLCMMLMDDPDLVREMVSFWTDFISAVMKPILARTSIDHFFINEDMAYKAKPMISPSMVREFITPAYERWIPEVRTAGCRVIEVDSDGMVEDLIPLWIESGVTCCSPMEVAAGCDLNIFRRKFGKKMAYAGGVDKRLMAKGGDFIKREMRRLSPVIKDGGYIPGCDHGVPSDVSWPDFVEYARLLAKETGWN